MVGKIVGRYADYAASHTYFLIKKNLIVIGMSDQTASHRQFQKIFDSGNKVRKNAENLLQGGIAIYNLSTNPKDLVAYRKLFDSVKFFIDKNPLGKVIMKLYEVHFTALFSVLEAVNIEFSDLQNNLNLLNEEIESFNNQSQIIINSTKLDTKLFLSGPFFLGAKIMSENPDLSQQDIKNLYPQLRKKAEDTILDLDELLTYYVKIQYLRQLIYQEAAKELDKNMTKSGTLKYAFADKLKDLNFLDNERLSTNFTENINSLITNRNDWTQWLGAGSRKNIEFYKKEEI